MTTQVFQRSPYEDATEKAVGVSLRNISKGFTRRGGGTVTALQSVSLDVPTGEVVVLLGSSGCGKTTLLRSIAGLETPDVGEIVIGGKCVFASDRHVAVPPERRNLGMMFQSYALWPHMTVWRNVAYPLEARRINKNESKERVDFVLQQVGIAELAGEYPSHLSGGQQQRVALCRSLVGEPSVVLFDEPLSSLDAKVRKRLRYELVKMQRSLGFTAIYVTHDQEEAMDMADTLVVLEGGVIAQAGSPEDVYSLPATRYVASFLGSVGEIEGQVEFVERDGDKLTIKAVCQHGQMVATCPADLDKHRKIVVGERVYLGVRPEQIELSASQPSRSTNVTSGIVERRSYLGSHWEYVVRLGTGTIEVWAPDDAGVDSGDTVWLWFKAVMLYRDEENDDLSQE